MAKIPLYRIIHLPKYPYGEDWPSIKFLPSAEFLASDKTANIRAPWVRREDGRPRVWRPTEEEIIHADVMAYYESLPDEIKAKIATVEDSEAELTS